MSARSGVRGTPSAAEPVVLGVDVGGTKVLAAEVDTAGRVLAAAARSTPGRRVEVGLLEAALTEAVLEVADGRPIAAVGLAAAGFVDREGERVMFAPHLPWRGEAVRDRLFPRAYLDPTEDAAELAFQAAVHADLAAGRIVLLVGEPGPGHLHHDSHHTPPELGIVVPVLRLAYSLRQRRARNIG